MSKIQSLMWAAGRHIVKSDKKKRTLTVIEYPKGGGTWVAKTIATALNLPFIGGGKFLPLIPSVIRSHWKPSASLTPGILVIRDPRDVMVSLFHHRARNISRTPIRRKQYEQLFGGQILEEHIEEQMAEFIELEFKDPRYGAHQNWTEYTKDALEAVAQSNGEIQIVRYEDMLVSPVSTLEQTLTDMGYQVPKGVIELAVKIHDKKWGDKKYSTASDETTFIRSGKSGGWADSFNQSSRECLNNWCGEELVKLGYEKNNEWVK